MSVAIVKIPLTLFGQTIAGISIPVGSTVEWDLAIQDPVTRAPFDLTGANVVLALSQLDATSNPLKGRAPLISRQATISSPSTAGNAVANWVANDTALFLPGAYGLEVWLTDASGNRLQSLAFVDVQLSPGAYKPGGSITPLPSQNPLAQGPPGNPRFAIIKKTGAYGAAFNDLVAADSTGGSFTVTLPAASGATVDKGAVLVKNQSDSVHPVSVAPAGLDTIDGAGALLLYARESALLFSDGVSDWMVLR